MLPDKLNKFLIVFYIGIVLAITVIVQMGIRDETDPEDIYTQNETADEESEGYVPLKVKIDRAKEEKRKAEETVRSFKVDPEFEEMIRIPAGEFIMGNEDHYDMKPVRKVYLSEYWIDKYEVTFAQYYVFMEETRQKEPRLAGYLSDSVTEDLHFFVQPLHPIVGIDWELAYNYCRWKEKRLPTEAEWEKAAKGPEERIWPWGDEERPEYANLVGEDDGVRYTGRVDGFKTDVSPYGVYAMAGNVMEWTADWYDQDSYRKGPARNPLGMDYGIHKVIRGASWNDSIKRAGAAVRFKMYPTYEDVTIGFRCARSGSSQTGL